MPNLEESTFRAVGMSDEKMYGHPAVMLAGATPEEQNAIRALMDAKGLAGIAAIAVTPATINTTLDELARLPDATGFGVAAKLPRAVVMSGLRETEFHALMNSYRAGDLPRPIWATVTPTSGSWTIKALLIELLKEGEALRNATRKTDDESGAAVPA